MAIVGQFAWVSRLTSGVPLGAWLGARGFALAAEAAKRARWTKLKGLAGRHRLIRPICWRRWLRSAIRSIWRSSPISKPFDDGFVSELRKHPAKAARETRALSATRAKRPSIAQNTPSTHHRKRASRGRGPFRRRQCAGCSAPPIDPHRGTLLDLRGIRRHPAWTKVWLSWMPHSCRRRPSCLADARTDGKAREPGARRAIRWSCRAFWSSMKKPTEYSARRLAT
ncbi:hypothetical protein V1289_005719 [Bradyrhizobium sp. AZCC 2289]